MSRALLKKSCGECLHMPFVMEVLPSNWMGQIREKCTQRSPPYDQAESAGPLVQILKL
jgi:hypothetical protein